MAAPSDENKRSPLKAWVRALERTAPIERDRTGTFPQLIEVLGERFGTACALSSPAESLSYRGLAARSRAVAAWGLAQGLTAADVVCLFMDNCPAYLAIWLGLTRIGVTVALVNTNLRGAALAHSLDTVGARYVISGPSLAPHMEALNRKPEHLIYGAGLPGLPRLDTALQSLAATAPDPARFRVPTLSDRALCIYTSGTTGLPKAANVSHYRLMQWSHWFAGLMDVTPADRMYNCLPLYHSVGGVVAVGATLVGGGTVVLRERFSASGFWSDVVRERCTLFQYIGELCRYLLNSAAHADERRHQLRLACGNGLRGEVWGPFQERFAIPQILEYYAATEGNFSLYNCEGRQGAIGRIPPFLSHRLPVALVQFDPASGLPVRDESGRCVRCKPGEAGEALGQILNSQDGSRFEGYTDAGASAQKILQDVFAPGDRWYRTGDLMRQDAQGFFYFVDRVGDTFRWKGENVSATEVAATIAACPGVSDVAVYGVSLPNRDGRAGMAAIVAGAEFSLPALHRALVDKLPAYARPLLVRLMGALEVTGTFKLRKQELMREGYDPGVVSDPLYVDDPDTRTYIPLDTAAFTRLQAGTMRV